MCSEDLCIRYLCQRGCLATYDYCPFNRKINSRRPEGILPATERDGGAKIDKSLPQPSAIAIRSAANPRKGHNAVSRGNRSEEGSSARNRVAAIAPRRVPGHSS